jgi:hypothetical protein
MSQHSPSGSSHEPAELPTWTEIVDHALEELNTSRNGLSEAAAWLRSDWRPLGTDLPPGAGDKRHEATELIGKAKEILDQAKGALHTARSITRQTSADDDPEMPSAR